MEWFRQWLLGITAAAMLNALAKSLMPKGIVRQIGQLTGGLVLLLAILQPIYRLDEGIVEEAFAPYVGQLETYRQIPEYQNDSFMKSIIETDCSAYIQDKAKEKGLECRAIVICGGEEGGYPYPSEVTISGDLTDQQRKWLGELIETDLGISSQYQTFRRESGEEK